MRFRFITAAVLVLTALSVSACAPAGAESNKKGLEAYENGDYKTAVYQFTQAVTQSPSVRSYYVNRGQAYISMGEYEAALDSFTNAINMDDSEYYSLRGAGLASMGLKQFTEAVSYFDRAIETRKGKKDSLYIDALGYRAEARESEGDYDGALTDYQSLVDEGYRTRDIYQLMGDIYLKKEDTAQALVYYQKCLDINNRDYEAYLCMADKLYEAGAEDAYQVVLNAALEVIPKEAEDWCYRGRVFLLQQDDSSAFSAFEESYNRGYAAAGYYLGYCYELRDKYDEALRLYQEQLENNPTDSRLYNQIAVCYIRQGKYDDAVVMIQKGLSTAEYDLKEDLLWNECVCYEKKLDYDTAIEKIREYLVMYPRDEDAARELSFLYER